VPSRRQIGCDGINTLLSQRAHQIPAKVDIELIAIGERPYPPFRWISLLFPLIGLG
jgi:hypothetical protein